MAIDFSLLGNFCYEIVHKYLQRSVQSERVSFDDQHAHIYNHI